MKEKRSLKQAILLLLQLTVMLTLHAQQLKPGFDKAEYINLLKVSAQFGDSAYSAAILPPAGYRLVYRSPVIGLDNRWDLWKDGQGIGIISIRGTTVQEISWIANFYMAMLPATGSLQLSKNETFPYQLSTHPGAAVHAGWLVGTGFLSKDILPRVDSCYKQGMKEYLIMGHSQGGAIAYLLTAYLLQQQKLGRLPADIRIKTYCSAAPKPGNLYFAYAFEAMTRDGWAYNVVNSADWVPETPISIQTLNDFNAINPFSNARATIKKQKGLKRWVLRYAYGRLSKPALKATRNYQQYLGRYVSKPVRRHLAGFKAPKYYNSSDYVRTGNTIVLVPDEAYYQRYPQDKQRIFVNHLHSPYLFLAAALPSESR